jgi:hypothetical protein
LPVPLNQLPWEFAKDQLGVQGADFIGVMGALILRSAKDQFSPYLLDPARLPSTVEATIWAMSEAEALLLSRSLRFSPQESALEQRWLLAEMEQRFGYGLDELARRFDRSTSWVSRRLALVELLPEAIQQQVREGKLAGLQNVRASLLTC